MKRALPFLLAFVILGFSNSCTKETSTPSTCNNLVKDNGETEIDCGGSCAACPATQSLYCRMGTSAYVGRPENTIGQLLSNSIRINSRDEAFGRYMNFTFIPAPIGQPISIHFGNFNYQGEPYTMDVDDSGSVTLSMNDTLRKIVSGSFWFTGKRLTGAATCKIDSGTFTNVRCTSE